MHGTYARECKQNIHTRMPTRVHVKVNKCRQMRTCMHAHTRADTHT